MTTRVRPLRLVGVVAVAAVVAATVQFSSPQSVQAAPVTCTGTVKVFDGRADGTLWYYEHRAPATGDYSWAGGRQIGAGFAGPTVASVDGYVYLVTSAGQLRRYRYGTTSWLDAGGTVMGTGWQAWSGDRRNKLTADTKGRLYTVDATGALVMFDSTVPTWNATAGIPLDLGWTGDRVIAAGDGVLYRLDDDTGRLTRYRYDADAQRISVPTPVAAGGWQTFERVYSPGGDILYGITGGTMYWYRYDADNGAWANGGNGRVVGAGWTNRVSVTAATSTCSIPPAPVVEPVTPVEADPARALELSGGAGNFSYLYRDAQGRAVEARDNGDALTRVTVGTKTFAGDLSSATSRDAAGTEQLLGVDATGALWLSEGTGTFGAWRPFGKGMRRAALTEAFAAADPVQALAVDGRGGLWWRMRSAPHHRWLPWQRVPGEVTDFELVASGPGGAYGASVFEWFTLERSGNTVTLQEGELPEDFESVAPAEVTSLPATLFARQTGTGAPVSWGPLPTLPTTLTQAPMSATQLGNGQLAVAGVGADGYVYVTTGDAETGQYLQWQRVGEKATGAVALVAPLAGEADLAYRGQDGKLYHYVAPVAAGSTAPLVFTGKGRA